MRDHPIYRKAAAEHMASGGASHVPLVDAAKLMRAALKARWPGIRFSVRSERYAGGSSIRVSWLDGPLQEHVQEAIAPYAGAGFDGMIDLQYRKGAWLRPDGGAEFRTSEGTTGSAPAYDVAASTREAVPVSFGVDYVFAERRRSVGELRNLMGRYAAGRNDDLADAIRAGKVEAAGEDGYAYMRGAEHIRVGDMWADVAIGRFQRESARKAAA